MSNKKVDGMIRFVDLFAGVGGVRKGLMIALEKHGFESQCVFSSEIDKKAQETYSLNYGEIPEGDIRLVEVLPEHDILLAGFPCQAFSYAGKQKGFADTRGTLFFEIERLLSKAKHKPKLMLLENSDAHRLGVVQNGSPRSITPRECARLKGSQTILFCTPMILGLIANWVILCLFPLLPQSSRI